MILYTHICTNFYLSRITFYRTDYSISNMNLYVKTDIRVSKNFNFKSDNSKIFKRT